MITNVPTGKDFEASGIALLNLAWDSTVGLLVAWLEAEDWSKVDAEIEPEYWKSAQTQLSTALTLAQQGTDFLLKARVAEVSPFLLIAEGPDKWPRGCHKQDTPFSDFRTVDSQDLVKVYDSVAPKRLEDEFTSKLEGLRILRNRIMHTVDPSIKLSAKEIIIAILESYRRLGPNQSWISIRKNYIEKRHDAIAFSWPDAIGLVANELDCIFDMLSRKEREEYLGIRHQRRYICLECQMNSHEFNPDMVPKYAQLAPNEPDSTNLYCLLCEKNITVVRKDCLVGDCPGNVIELDENTCLTCGEQQEDVESVEGSDPPTNDDEKTDADILANDRDESPENGKDIEL